MTADPTLRLAVKPTRLAAAAASSGEVQDFERQPRRVLPPALLGAQKIGAALDPFDADWRGGSGAHLLWAWAVRPTASCGHGRDGAPRSGAPSWSTCACGIHAGACGRSCSVDRCVSLRDLRKNEGPQEGVLPKGPGLRCQPRRLGFPAARLGRCLLDIGDCDLVLGAHRHDDALVVGRRLMLRTTPPPEGIGKVWNVSVFGSKRTRPFGLELPSSYQTMPFSTVMP